MRLSATLFLIILTCLSCKKESNGTLDGKWKMVRYYDRNTNALYSKPASSENVFLEFDGNNFIAYSDNNESCDGTYTLNGDGITFNTINSYFTAATDGWSDMFFWAIQACQLQSTYPCKPSELKYSPLNQIRINTVLRMDIMLTRVQ